MSSEYVHDPNAVLDYIVDWSKWLRKNETITATNFAVFGGVDLDSSSNTATLTVAWVSGGTEGTVAGVRHRITTNQGRTDDRTITLNVAER